MGLLDELKKEADIRKKADASRAKDSEVRAARARATALPKLARIHRYLLEFVEHLQILKNEISVTLPIPGLGDVAGFKQGGYGLHAEGKPPEIVSLRCVLRLKRSVNYKVKGAGPPGPWFENLRRQGLQPQAIKVLENSRPSERTIITLTGALPASLQFGLELEAEALQLVVRNFDGLGERRHVIKPADVTDRWLEELARYVLRRDNRFLVQELSPELRAYFRRRLEQEKRQALTLEDSQDLQQPAAAAPALKPPSKRRSQLTLRYRNQTFHLAELGRYFVMGRHDDCDLNVRESRVSRFHARIEVREDHYILIDASRNGTNVRFADGSILRLKNDSGLLRDSGLIALATEPVESNPDVIRFSL